MYTNVHKKFTCSGIKLHEKFNVESLECGYQYLWNNSWMINSKDTVQLASPKN